MSKILRSSNRVNTQMDISSNQKSKRKIPSKTVKEDKAEIMKDKRKRRHKVEENQQNEIKNENEEQKENTTLSNNDPIDDMEEPSEYELLRQRNIEQRRLMFQQLDIEQVRLNIFLVNFIMITLFDRRYVMN